MEVERCVTLPYKGKNFLFKYCDTREGGSKNFALVDSRVKTPIYERPFVISVKSNENELDYLTYPSRCFNKAVMGVVRG